MSELKRLDVPFSLGEYARLTEHASLRGLPTSSLIRFVVLGALKRGGGSLDVLVHEGELVAELKSKARPGRAYPKLWVNESFGHYHFASDPRWRLTSPRKRGEGRTIDKDDKSKWWVLTRPDGLTVPTAFSKPDAMKIAVDYIEGHRGD